MTINAILTNEGFEQTFRVAYHGGRLSLLEFSVSESVGALDPSRTKDDVQPLVPIRDLYETRPVSSVNTDTDGVIQIVCTIPPAQGLFTPRNFQEIYVWARVNNNSIELSVDLDDVNVGTNGIRVTYAPPTGTKILFSSTNTLPAPLQPNRLYYVIRVSPTEIRIADTAPFAETGVAISLQDVGIGAHTIELSDYISEADVSAATDIITVNQDWKTGSEVRLTPITGVLPEPLQADQSYYVIRISETEIKLAASVQDATDNIPIELDTQGIGLSSIRPYRFLYLIGQPEESIRYLPTGAVTFRINLQADNIQGLLTFDYTQAEEVKEHNTDPNAHPNLLEDFYNTLDPEQILSSLSKATILEAETGTDDFSYMTALKTFAAINSRFYQLKATEAQAMDVDDDIHWISPHTLNYVIDTRLPQTIIASIEDAEQGNEVPNYMSPDRTKAAITYQTAALQTQADDATAAITALQTDKVNVADVADDAAGVAGVADNLWMTPKADRAALIAYVTPIADQVATNVTDISGKVNIADKALLANVQPGTDDTMWMSPLMVDEAISYRFLDMGDISADTLVLQSSVPSTDRTSGALIVAGGVGITHGIYASFITTDNATFEDLVVNNTLQVGGVSTFTDMTDDIYLSGTGAMNISGGVSIGGNTKIDKTLYVGEALRLTEMVAPPEPVAGNGYLFLAPRASETRLHLYTLDNGIVEIGTKATEAEAVLGLDTYGFMTPYLVKASIDTFAPHYEMATNEEADAGVEDSHYMTPYKVKRAIDALSDYNLEKANLFDARQGTKYDDYMTPLMTAEAIQWQLSGELAQLEINRVNIENLMADRLRIDAIASEQQALDGLEEVGGIESEHWMTPYLTKLAIDLQTDPIRGRLDVLETDIVRKVEFDSKASVLTTIRGVNDDRWVTALGVKGAIDEHLQIETTSLQPQTSVGSPQSIGISYVSVLGVNDNYLVTNVTNDPGLVRVYDVQNGTPSHLYNYRNDSATSLALAIDISERDYIVIAYNDRLVLGRITGSDIVELHEVTFSARAFQSIKIDNYFVYLTDSDNVTQLYSYAGESLYLEDSEDDTKVLNSSESHHDYPRFWIYKETGGGGSWRFTQFNVTNVDLHIDQMIGSADAFPSGAGANDPAVSDHVIFLGTSASTLDIYESTLHYVFHRVTNALNLGAEVIKVIRVVDRFVCILTDTNFRVYEYDSVNRTLTSIHSNSVSNEIGLYANNNGTYTLTSSNIHYNSLGRNYVRLRRSTTSEAQTASDEWTYLTPATGKDQFDQLIQPLGATVTQNSTDIDTNAYDITVLEGNMTDLTNLVNTYDGRITTNDGDIDTINSTLSSYDSRITVNEGDIADLQANKLSNVSANTSQMQAGSPDNVYVSPADSKYYFDWRLSQIVTVTNTTNYNWSDEWGAFRVDGGARISKNLQVGGSIRATGRSIFYGVAQSAQPALVAYKSDDAYNNNTVLLVVGDGDDSTDLLIDARGNSNPGSISWSYDDLSDSVFRVSGVGTMYARSTISTGAGVTAASTITSTGGGLSVYGGIYSSDGGLSVYGNITSSNGTLSVYGGITSTNGGLTIDNDLVFTDQSHIRMVVDDNPGTTGVDTGKVYLSGVEPDIGLYLRTNSDTTRLDIKKANVTEAEEGLDEDKFMTPYLVKQAIFAWPSNLIHATVLEAQEGTQDTHYMSPVRVKNAIDAQVKSTLTLDGDATGSVSLDGSGTATLTVAVVDNSHSHTTSNISDINLDAVTDRGATTTNAITTGGLRRYNHHVGHLQGYHASESSSVKTNPIYVIGTAHNPNEEDLNNMYGIGYTNTSASFISGTLDDSSGWGLYVAADGDARVFLNGTDGTVRATGSFYSNGQILATQAWVALQQSPDSDTVDGYHASTVRNAPNTVPVRDSNGYLNLGWINTTSGDTTAALSRIYVDTGDQYLRKTTLSHFRSQVTDGVYLPIGGKAADSELLDGINSSSFLRSDANDYLYSAIIVPDAYRDEGMFGTYDSYKTQHIWSMGTAYRNHASGSNFGNIYGLSYYHPNCSGVQATYGDLAGGHQVVFATNGVPRSALGTGIWTSGTLSANAISFTSPITISVNGDMSGSVDLNGSGTDTLTITLNDNSSLYVRSSEKADQVTAEAATSDSHWMTPLQTLNLIESRPAQLTLATQTEAEDGTNNTRFMSPLRTAQAITAQTATLVSRVTTAENDINTLESDKVNKSDLATNAQATAGSNNTQWMSPLRVRESVNWSLANINTLTIHGSTNSSSKDTGSLVLASGGLGVEGNIYAGGYIYAGSSARVDGTMTTYGINRVYGNLDINAWSTYNGNITAEGNLQASGTASFGYANFMSTSAWIGQDLTVSETITVNGVAEFNSTLYADGAVNFRHTTANHHIQSTTDVNFLSSGDYPNDYNNAALHVYGGVRIDKSLHVFDDLALRNGVFRMLEVGTPTNTLPNSMSIWAADDGGGRTELYLRRYSNDTVHLLSLTLATNAQVDAGTDDIKYISPAKMVRGILEHTQELPHMKITDNTATTSATTGAFQVVGGVGIGGDIYLDGSQTIGTNLTLIGTATIYNNLTVETGGIATFNDNVLITGDSLTTDPGTTAYFNDSSDATGINTGAVRVVGGISSQKTIFANTAFQTAGYLQLNEMASAPTGCPTTAGRIYTLDVAGVTTPYFQTSTGDYELAVVGQSVPDKASQAQAEAGSDDGSFYMNPLKVYQAIDAFAVRISDGAGSVGDEATLLEAQAGVNGVKYMTPRRVADAITEQTSTLVGRVTTNEGDISTLQSDVTALEGNRLHKVDDLASSADAISTTIDDKWMSPKKVYEAVYEHAGVIPDIATQLEAETGTDNVDMMTPLRTAQAIQALAVELTHLRLTNTTPADNASTGALIVEGGIASGDDIWADGAIHAGTNLYAESNVYAVNLVLTGGLSTGAGQSTTFGGGVTVTTGDLTLQSGGISVTGNISSSAGGLSVFGQISGESVTFNNTLSTITSPLTVSNHVQANSIEVTGNFDLSSTTEQHHIDSTVDVNFVNDDAALHIAGGTRIEKSLHVVNDIVSRSGSFQVYETSEPTRTTVSRSISSYTPANDTIQVDCTGWATEDLVVISTDGFPPSPLAEYTVYYLIYVDNTQCRLATTRANALSNTYVNFGSTGTGSHSLVKLENSIKIFGLRDGETPELYMKDKFDNVRLLSLTVPSNGDALAGTDNITYMTPLRTKSSIKYNARELDYLELTDTTETVSATTGTLIVGGGGGFGGNIFAAGDITTQQDLTVTVDATVWGDLTVHTLSTFNDNVTINADSLTGDANLTISLPNATTSTSASTGAIQVAGGVGIGKDLYVGGYVTLAEITDPVDSPGLGEGRLFAKDHAEGTKLYFQSASGIEEIPFTTGLAMIKATTTEAEEGTNDTWFMTPYTVKHSIEFRAVLLEDKADYNDAITGTDDTQWMTPLRVFDAIDQKNASLSSQVSDNTTDISNLQTDVANRVHKTDDKASALEALETTNNVRYMTPQRVYESIQNFAQSPLAKATQALAEAGTDDDRYMTPLTTSQAIQALATDLTHLNLSAGTQSTSTTTGTLIVTGGVGVSMDAFFGNNLDVANELTATKVTTDELVIPNGGKITVAEWGQALEFNARIQANLGQETNFGSNQGAIEVPNGGIYVGGNISADGGIWTGEFIGFNERTDDYPDMDGTVTNSFLYVKDKAGTPTLYFKCIADSGVMIREIPFDIGTLIDLASQSESENGDNVGKYMNPLRTQQAITFQTSGIVSDVSQNASDILDRLKKVDDAATQAEAEAGTVVDHYMTPDRTAQAITAQTASIVSDVGDNASDITALQTQQGLNTTAIGDNATNIATNASDIAQIQTDLGSVVLDSDKATEMIVLTEQDNDVTWMTPARTYQAITLATTPPPPAIASAAEAFNMSNNTNYTTPYWVDRIMEEVTHNYTTPQNFGGGITVDGKTLTTDTINNRMGFGTDSPQGIAQFGSANTTDGNFQERIVIAGKYSALETDLQRMISFVVISEDAALPYDTGANPGKNWHIGTQASHATGDINDFVFIHKGVVQTKLDNDGNLLVGEGASSASKLTVRAADTDGLTIEDSSGNIRSQLVVSGSSHGKLNLYSSTNALRTVITADADSYFMDQVGFGINDPVHAVEIAGHLGLRSGYIELNEISSPGAPVGAKGIVYARDNGTETGLFYQNESREVELSKPQLEKASTADAQAATDDEKYITPAKLQDFLDAHPGGVTIASESEARAGTNDTRMMTPLKTKQAIDEFASQAGIATEAGEDLTAGDFVYIYGDAGVTKSMKASPDGEHTIGFVLESVLAGESVSVISVGVNPNLSGLTPGTRYYLGASGGVTTSQPDARSGDLFQLLGMAISSTSLFYNFNPPVRRL